MLKLRAKELRTTQPTPEQIVKIKRHPLYLILDNVLDTYNVGAIFRLADAVAASKVYLCGQTLTPPNSRIKKASINTWQWVDWEYAKSAKEAIARLKNGRWEVGGGKLTDFEVGSEKNGESSLTSKIQPYPASVSELSHLSPLASVHIVAIEQHPKSIPYDKADYKLPLAVVVGNETFGVSKEVLALADEIVEIPVFGVNKSLNVMVALGIVLYKIMEKVG